MPEFNPPDSDFIELEIQNLKAHANLEGDFINNGQIEMQEEIEERL